jgi:hypothetical protein
MNFKKTNLFLYFIKGDILNRYGGMEVYLHTFFTLLLDGGEWLDSRTETFTLKEGIAAPTG